MQGLAVVTGTSSGMGSATAEALLAAGYQVLGVDLNESPFPNEPCYLHVATDIVDRESVKTAVAKGTKWCPLGIRVVANVAGIYPPSTLADFTPSLYRRVFDVNVLGVLNLIAECVPHMSDGGSIINFASVDGIAVSPGQLLYGASKAAVIMLTKELALELAPRAIRVNAIAPGWVNTPGNAATGRMAAAAASIPLGRVAQPSEIAAWVGILADETASFMTGETLVLSGGDVIR